MFLPDSVKRIIELLQKSSFKAYAVGGCVRDAIMGRNISDYDITTSALPEQVEEVLEKNGLKYIETGLKHGTVTALIEHVPYEITTFRKDGDYLDNRHPESVLFVNDVKEDLSRRDFTINALAYNEQEGFIDLFGGRQDIERKLIKTVGNADERFNEDALRIMRALRFASQLSFEIEEETKRSIIKNKELLKNIAVERILVELKKLLLGDNCAKILYEYIEVIRAVIPELKGEYIGAIQYAPRKDYIRLALLLTDAENSGDILKRLRVSNEILSKATTLIGYSKSEIENNSICIKKLLNEISEDLFFDLLEYKKALLNDAAELDAIGNNAKEIIKNKEPYRLSDLTINGFNLMELGFKGKEISEMLEKLLSEVIDNPAKNEKEILLNIASHFLSRKNPRLEGFNYSSNGAYFVTICTKDKKCILSKIDAYETTNVGEGFHTLPRVTLTPIGNVIENTIKHIMDNTQYVDIVRYVIMPNHIHFIVEIHKPSDCSAGGCGNPPLQEIVRRIKTYTTKQYGAPLWQRSFYDHIIRDEEDYLNHLQYIEENPMKWLQGKDEYYS